ncbi:AAA family ATPase [Indiicoccus explosivorum]|uniref:AAA family ATPase n=1 Tax=Indiicoccus explosivorum TaxID=1917864 RepID=UPI000B4450F4|nr:AAA family ATPase [Indiicoccus explosivorum]
MIIMINGAFGVGKTTVANELLPKIDNSMLFDPETVGFMLREIIPDTLKRPSEQTDNFQDLKLWKVLVVEMARQLKAEYGRHLIVPMTLADKEIFTFIQEGFRQIDPDTVHYCLTASKEVIHERLRGRGERDGDWCFRKTDMCLAAFDDPAFERRIPTSGIRPQQVTEHIHTSIREQYMERTERRGQLNGL